jgi:Protein of unknown function (DUF1566)
MKKTLGTMVAIIVVASLIGTFITAKSSTAGEKAKDGRFIAYDNGTVLDTKTKLMWAAKDNGSDINWQDAKFYCENYHGGGYTDWRMPTLDELDGLYDASKSHPAACYGRNSIHVATELIDITCFCPWASETSETTGEADFFDFGPGIRSGFASQLTRFSRALPVRSGK